MARGGGGGVNDYNLRSLVLFEDERFPLYMYKKSCHRQSSIHAHVLLREKHGNPSDRGFEDNTRIDRTSEQSRVDGEVE